MNFFTRNKLISAFSIILFFSLWEILAKSIDSVIILPTLGQVLESFLKFTSTSRFWLSLASSFGRVILAFILTLVAGTILGLFSGLSDGFSIFLKFPLSIIRTTPVVALIMVMLFWFDSQSLPVICAVLMNLPVMIDSVSKSIRNSDKKLLQMAQIFDFSRRDRIFSVYVPQIRPYFTGTARTVFAQGWKVVAAGEILALPRYAMGSLIQDNRIILETPAVFALTITLSLLCILSEKLIFAFVKVISYLGVSLPRENRGRVGSFAAMASASEPAVSASQPAQAPDATVSVRDLSFSYKGASGEALEIFQNFSADFRPYKKTAIVSPTGRGKTTLLNILAGLIPSNEYQGKVSCPKTSFIFQDSRLIPGVTVLKNVALPLFSQMPRKNAYARALEYLEKVGLANKALEYPENLSGGEKQKVQAARAFAFNTDVLLMDEGTSSLDEVSRHNLWDTIEMFLKEKSRTVIFVTHNKDEAGKYADTILELK